MQVLSELQRLGVTPAGLCADSRALAPGDVFVAYAGAQRDGRRFIGDAVARGAAAVLWESDGFAWNPQWPVPNLALSDLRALSGYLAHLVYGRPTDALWTVGVTGTNGKTSVSQWVAQALALLGQSCAVVGTLGSGFPGRLAETANTTPDAPTLHRQCAAFLAAGARAVAMEVSSIGLDQGRVNGIHFDVAVLTNLTRDHLEYHGTMEAYAAAKARLFATEGLRAAILNLDDPLGVELAARLRGSSVRRVGTTLRADSAAAADVDTLLRAEEIEATPRGIAFTVAAPQGRARVAAPVLGEFNVANLLAVLGVLLERAVTLEQAVAVLPRLVPPAGRMQTVAAEAGPLVVVDYAHTPDALEKALGVLRATARARAGRLVCVFGCGGDRDPGKRPLMGEVAARMADRVLLTSDNPRGEDPLTILEHIAAGAPGAEQVPDRASAIRRAILSAAVADVVLVAGKGHEPYQEAGAMRLPFSDAQQAADALRAWAGAAQ